MYQVKEGWGPLCTFLGVLTPSVPFPNVNDTSQIEQSRKTLLYSSLIVIVLLPILTILGVFLLDSSGYAALAILGGLGLFIYFQASDVTHMK